MLSEGSPFASWTELERSLAAEQVELDNKSGWMYLRAIPGSRQRRKRMRSMPWVVHLYSGPEKHVDPVFREMDDGRVLVQIDINRSKAEDMGMVAFVYRALLWAAATGRIDGIIGSPPTRVDLVQKMMWLVVVAKAARSHHGGHPVFMMFEGKKLMDLVRLGGVEKWSSISFSWDSFTELMCLEDVSESMATNLRFDPEHPESTSGSAAWTHEFKEAVVEASAKWVVESSEGERLLPLDGDITHQVFDPKIKHSTKPWYGGSRIALIAYSTRYSAKLKNHQVKYLQDFGFDWVPHYSKPVGPQEEKTKLAVMCVGLMNASKGRKMPDEPPDGSDHRDEDHESDDEEEHVERGANKDSLLHVTHDVELAIGTHAASLVAKRLSYVSRLGKRLLSYLAGTADLRMTMGQLDL